MTAMIARAPDANASIWAELSAPLPQSAIQWRQDGRPVSRDGRHIARFVGYIDAHFVHDRFDAVVPGEWDSTLELLPPAVSGDGEEVEPFAFKCRIQVLGVVREDVGTGKDYKSAASDAFKRAAVRFGIGKELYSLGQNWVQMDGDGKYAKPVEDPGVAYARRYGGGAGVKSAGNDRRSSTGMDAVRAVTGSSNASASQQGAPASPPPVIDGQQDYGAVPERERGEQASGTDEISKTSGPLASDEPSCPKCGGRMWDNRLTKRNPKAPNYKCRDRGCDGVIWPPKPTRQQRNDDDDPRLSEETEEIPF